MNRLATLLIASASIAGLASAALAGGSVSSEVSLCQKDVFTQISMEHQKAKIDFNNKETSSTPGSGNEVQVRGKGKFTKQDGTIKKFEYTCTVNTAEGRVVNASVTKTDTKRPD
jgi:hypothetical protein